jgi:hypothetical protein
MLRCTMQRVLMNFTTQSSAGNVAMVQPLGSTVKNGEEVER